MEWLICVELKIHRRQCLQLGKLDFVSALSANEQSAHPRVEVLNSVVKKLNYLVLFFYCFFPILTQATTITGPFDFLANNFAVPAQTVADLYRYRWQVGVPGEGYIIQSVKVRPGPGDSGLVAWEAPWRESKTVKPSDHVLDLEYSNVPGCNIQ